MAVPRSNIVGINATAVVGRHTAVSSLDYGPVSHADYHIQEPCLIILAYGVRESLLFGPDVCRHFGTLIGKLSLVAVYTIVHVIGGHTPVTYP